MARFITLHIREKNGDTKPLYVNVEQIIHIKNLTISGTENHAEILCNNVYIYTEESAEEVMSLIHCSGKGRGI